MDGDLAVVGEIGVTTGELTGNSLKSIMSPKTSSSEATWKTLVRATNSLYPQPFFVDIYLVLQLSCGF